MNIEKYKDKPKAALAAIVEGLRAEKKRAHVVGSPAATAVAFSVNMILRHAATSLLGPAKGASVVQQVVNGLVTVGLAGVRVGLAGQKETTAIVTIASAVEGAAFAGLERAIESLAQLQPD